MKYTLFLTVISLALTFLWPGASYHTNLAEIYEYLQFATLTLTPICLWLVFLVNRKYQLLNPLYIAVINTALFVLIPVLAAQVGYKMKEYERFKFSELQKTIQLNAIKDSLFVSQDQKPFGIRLAFTVRSPANVTPYPLISVEPSSQPSDVLKPRYPGFRYYQCTIKDEKGEIIASLKCKDMHYTAYKSLQWPTLSKNRDYTFIIDMVPENCMSMKWFKKEGPMIGSRPFSRADFGVDTAIYYNIKITLFNSDGRFLTEKKQHTNMQYTPRKMYAHLFSNKRFHCY